MTKLFKYRTVKNKKLTIQDIASTSTSLIIGSFDEAVIINIKVGDNYTEVQPTKEDLIKLNEFLTQHLQEWK